MKMCPFCEGHIPSHVVNCKYCGSSLVGNFKKQPHDTIEENLAKLYDPPYSPNRTTSPFAQSYADSDMDYTSDDLDDDENYETPIKTKEEDVESSQIGSLLLLSIGGQLFTLAWLIFFFADHGRLTLEWKSRYWFIYFLISLPLIYNGWKKLRRS